ncbi:MAG TPA: PspC domain-containing protein [Solirubrobacteraceae bacterium]|jgi:signal transduction histidine kinase|nr:PspC domain-containing protein [Solirubrobacteraceae bacterium]
MAVSATGLRPRRRPDRAVLAGLCAGIAEQTGIDVTIVRTAWLLLCLVGGVGIALYVLLWSVAIPSGRAAKPGLRARVAGVLVPALVAGAMLAAIFHLRRTGLWAGDSLIWSLLLTSCGLVLLWRHSGDGSAPGRRLQAVLGGGLVAAAAVAFLHGAGALHQGEHALGAIIVVLVAASLMAGPWTLGMVRSLGVERARRIREQERAEVAAHLHDSVLQTLALIQKRAQDPREVSTLARRQERELRAWLHEPRSAPAPGSTLMGELRTAAAEVEGLHGVPIELVTVGDRALEEPAPAVIQAAREAMSNAARFAGAERIDVYAESGPDAIELFVRDRGCGFDPQTTPADRRGVRESIIGRMQRHGGEAIVRSALGEGTEVELRVHVA